MRWSETRSAVTWPGQPQQGTELDDATLVAAAQADLRAFTPLYERYVDQIYRYCYARLGTRELAEDATSEVFFKALTAIERYQDGIFAAWLFRIAHNVVVDIYRRRSTAPLDVAGDPPDPAWTPESVALSRVESETVRDALAQLPPDERAVVELPYAGWTGQQIASALGRSPDAVKQLRYRALRRLRTLLTQPGDESGEAHDA